MAGFKVARARGVLEVNEYRTAGVAALMGEARCGWDDPWSSVMAWSFAVCDAIEFRTDSEVPAEWEYRPSPIQDDIDTDSYPDSMVAELIESGTVTADDLIHVGTVLVRYAAWCKRDEVDY